MALTPLRWLAAAATGALLVFGWFLAPRTSRERHRDPRDVLLAREQSLSRAASRAADRLRAAIVIDSVRRSLRSGAGSDSMRVAFSGGLRPAVPPAVREVLARSAALVGPGPLPVDVAVVQDTASVVRGAPLGTPNWLRAEYVSPSAAGERCLVVLRLNPRRNESLIQSGSIGSLFTEARLLGPCAFIGAFGTPGPHVAQWLRDGGWRLAHSNSFTQRPARWQPPPWATNPDRTDPSGQDIRPFVSTGGYRCITGDRVACEAEVMQPTSPQQTRVSEIWGERVVSIINFHWWWSGLPLGPHQPTLLASLVHELGPDRFRQFWTSTRPVPDAFREAAGRDLGTTVQYWAAGQYRDGRRRGPGLPRGSAPMAGGLALVAGAVAVVMARRRQAT